MPDPYQSSIIFFGSSPIWGNSYAVNYRFRIWTRDVICLHPKKDLINVHSRKYSNYKLTLGSYDIRADCESASAVNNYLTLLVYVVVVKIIMVGHENASVTSVKVGGL